MYFYYVNFGESVFFCYSWTSFLKVLESLGGFMRGLLASVCAIAVSGCMAPRIDASSYAVDYNRTVAIEANETMLLNIVRAAHGDTRHFTSINAVNARFTAQRGGNIGLTTGGDTLTQTITEVMASSEAEGASSSDTDATADASRTLGGSAGFSLSYQQQPTFTISVSNTPEFAQGTSAPISEDTLINVVANGYPDEMITAILVDSVFLEATRHSDIKRNQETAGTESSKETFRLQVSNPNIEIDIESIGDKDLSSEQCPNISYSIIQNNLVFSLRERGAPDELFSFPANSENLEHIGDLMEAGFSLRRDEKNQAGEGEPRLAVVPRQTRSISLGLDFHALSDRDNRVLEGCIFSAGSRASIEEEPAADIARQDSGGGFEVSLMMRSPQGAINGVGAHLNNRIGCNNGVGSPSCRPTLINGQELLSINRAPLDSDPGNSPAHTVYGDDRWFVPENSVGDGNRHRTMEVFQLLQTLINLNRSADELRSPAFIQVN